MISEDTAIKIAALAALNTGEEAISWNADNYITVGCWGRGDYHNEVMIDFKVTGKVIVSYSSQHGATMVRNKEKIKELLSDCNLEVEFYDPEEEPNPFIL